jgi:hypothetical protein
MRLVFLLCLGTGVSLGAPPAVLEARTNTAVTDAQVANWVRVWQKRLRLDDWKVDAHIVRSTDLKPETLGNLKWNTATHTAVIKVLNPLDYNLSPAEIAEDIEYTVVHELVHLQLSVLPRDINKKDVEETVVNKLADALMQFERGDGFRARSQPVVPYRTKPGDAPQSPDIAGRQSGH